MARELKPEQNTEVAPDVSAILEPPKSYRLYIVLGFVVVILLQTFIMAAAFRSWFPPPGLPNMGLNPSDNAGLGLDEAGLVPPNIGKREEVLEKPINEGKALKVKQTVYDQTETFSLILHVRVRKKDERKFDLRYEACKQTIRDRLESMLAVSSTEDRKEAGSTAIKAKAKKVINDELGFPYVQEVLVSEKVTELQ